MAQQVLKSLIASSAIQCTTTSKAQVEEIWNMHCRPRQEFAGFQFARFPARLRAMQKRHLEQIGHTPPVGTKKTKSPPQAEPPEPHAWRDSVAQQIIKSLLNSGEIQCTSMKRNKWWKHGTSIVILGRSLLDFISQTSFPEDFELCKSVTSINSGMPKWSMLLCCCIKSTSQLQKKTSRRGTVAWIGCRNVP